MSACSDYYKYIIVYVDDLLIISRDCKSILKYSEDTCKFKFKRTGTNSYHLGCNFFRNKEGVFCFTPKKYVEKIISIFRTIFEYKPNNKIYSPFKKEDYLILDIFKILN